MGVKSQGSVVFTRFPDTALTVMASRYVCVNRLCIFSSFDCSYKENQILLSYTITNTFVIKKPVAFYNLSVNYNHDTPSSDSVFTKYSFRPSSSAGLTRMALLVTVIRFVSLESYNEV